MSENSSDKIDSSKSVSLRAWSVGIKEWKFRLACSLCFRCHLWLDLSDTDMKPTSARRATRELSCSAKTMLFWMTSHNRLHRLCTCWRRWSLPSINSCGETKRSFFRSSFVRRSAISVAGVVVICSKKSTFVQNRWLQSTSFSFKNIRWKRNFKTINCLTAAMWFWCWRVKKALSSLRINWWQDWEISVFQRWYCKLWKTAQRVELYSDNN